MWFGHKFKKFVKQGYFSGGAGKWRADLYFIVFFFTQFYFLHYAGYVLSKEALRRFAEDGLENNSICRYDPGGAEDVEMGTKFSTRKTVHELVLNIDFTKVNAWRT